MDGWEDFILYLIWPTARWKWPRMEAWGIETWTKGFIRGFFQHQVFEVFSIKIWKSTRIHSNCFGKDLMDSSQIHSQPVELVGSSGCWMEADVIHLLQSNCSWLWVSALQLAITMETTRSSKVIYLAMGTHYWHSIHFVSDPVHSVLLVGREWAAGNGHW